MTLRKTRTIDTTIWDFKDFLSLCRKYIRIVDTDRILHGLKVEKGKGFLGIVSAYNFAGLPLPAGDLMRWKLLISHIKRRTLEFLNNA